MQEGFVKQGLTKTSFFEHFIGCRIIASKQNKSAMVTDRTLDILLVEDELSSSLLSEKIKLEFQEDVRVHKNGKGILNDLNQYKNLDLIIVDKEYSQEDIIDTLKTVRRKSPYTEVIVLSSTNETKVVDHVKKAGAYDYIYKDRGALDKVIYSIKGFWTNKRLHNENIALKSSKNKSTGAIVAMVLIVLAIIIAGIYFLVR